ncbi:hypothetical protein NW755_009277 [Fusarium falciforme]|uniref:Uncharacterized protein n=1 Tax=Fusarium falciforme TaxID=195108 RepID=A0A9W8R3Q3_9HYPO|nr:hypothetical protein NW755_009277 [Fusarium falciforme]
MTLPSSISSYRNFPNPPCTYLLTASSVRVSLKNPLQKRRGFCIPHATDASIRPWPPPAIATYIIAVIHPLRALALARALPPRRGHKPYPCLDRQLQAGRSNPMAEVGSWSFES